MRHTYQPGRQVRRLLFDHREAQAMQKLTGKLSVAIGLALTLAASSLAAPSSLSVHMAAGADKSPAPLLICLDPQMAGNIPQTGQDLNNCGVSLVVARRQMEADKVLKLVQEHLKESNLNSGPIYWVCSTAKQVEQLGSGAEVLYVPSNSFEKQPVGHWKNLQIFVANESATAQSFEQTKNLTSLDRLDQGDLGRTNSPLQLAVRKTLVEWNPPAVIGYKGSRWVKSPNWGMRPCGEVVDTVVVHSTVINTMEGTIRAFQDDKVRRVSAHYCIDRDGSVVQMVDERLTSWHAGVSELEGKPGVNGFSIGIELINLNDGKDPYPPAQVQSLSKVIRDIRSRWRVPDSRIVSHALIARPIGRKNDPLGFDFDQLLHLINQP